MKRSILEISDLSIEEINQLIYTAEDIIKNPKAYSKKCEGKKLAVLFYEPSTRTRLSFEAAMYELGGNVLGFSEGQSSSASKGESVRDTVHIMSYYSDIIAMRHPKDGAPRVAQETSLVPIINAGDGGHHHPTQTLTDLLTIHREFNRLDNLKIGICGDLKYGRTVHSLISAMIRYKNIEFVLISPEELKLPDYVTEILKKNNIKYYETTDLTNAINELDILYMTRIQRERFSDLTVYEKLKDSYILTLDKISSAKKSLRILHPLPRVNEISINVDSDSRAVYFKQAENGKYIRMALILFLLSSSEVDGKIPGEINNINAKCSNRNCITHFERELSSRYYLDSNGKVRCGFCDNLIKN